MSSKIPFLTFHAIDGKPHPISITPRGFADGLQKLTGSGFSTITVRDAAHYLTHKLPFPERTVVLTFDDGYASVYDTALRLLETHKFTATIFLTANKESVAADVPLPSMNGRAMLSWRQVHELHKYGIEIGAHTVTHPDLTQLSYAQAESEILTNKSIIENALGAPVTSFAYPFGRYNQNAYEIVKQHFACACTDRLQLVTLKSDAHLLGRVDAYYLRNAAWLNLLPFGVFDWYVRARAVPRNVRRSLTAFPAG